MDIQLSGRSRGRSRAVVCISRQRGIASVLAMLYLVLFSTLAIGFYVGAGIQGQVARNDRMMQQAQIAADSGMSWIRCLLGNAPIPAGPASGVMDALVAQLGPMLNGTPNMSGNTVKNTGGTIWVPAANQWVTIDPAAGTAFRAKITSSGINLIVIVTGRGNSTGGSALEKAIELQYQPAV
ncbi:MAG TPA: pilus assembly PilX N-terminal domain-containing protein, partial [Tepidisphaeraceae bacterium]